MSTVLYIFFFGGEAAVVSTAAALRMDALDIREQANPFDRTGNHALADSRTIGRFDQRQPTVFDNGRRPGRINL